MNLNAAQLKWMPQLRESMTLERLKPQEEALFMDTKGDCKELMDPLGSHNKACAEGVALIFLRGFPEIPQLQQEENKMHAGSLVRGSGWDMISLWK